jgi:hypothetical protein
MAARVRTHALDVALADGVPAESTPALALRARRLTALCDRREKAATYRSLIREALGEVSGSRMRVAPYRQRVAAASQTLSRLADALTQAGPVAPRGAAEAALLLTDGTGPLYNPGAAPSLEACARRALGDLALS